MHHAPLRLLAFLLAFSLLAAVPGHAVSIAAGDSANTTEPTEAEFNFPWNNVGQVNGASGIFLGDINNDGHYWVLTASHVAGALPTSVWFNGTGGATLDEYYTVADSFVHLTNTGVSGLSGYTDMVMFQIDLSGQDFSNLVTLTLANTAPTTSDTLYMVGYGGGTKRWGTNHVEGNLLNKKASPTSFGWVKVFQTHYDAGLGGSEAQAIGGDSGGAVFRKNGTTWELVGMMDLASETDTYSMDIASYRNNILAAAIPEPGTYALVMLGIAGICFQRRRKIRRA